jgi:hypothetical protein
MNGENFVSDLVPTQRATAIKLRTDSPFSLREKVRMRGIK